MKNTGEHKILKLDEKSDSCAILSKTHSKSIYTYYRYQNGNPRLINFDYIYRKIQQKDKSGEMDLPLLKITISQII